MTCIWLIISTLSRLKFILFPQQSADQLTWGPNGLSLFQFDVEIEKQEPGDDLAPVATWSARPLGSELVGNIFCSSNIFTFWNIFSSGQLWSLLRGRRGPWCSSPKEKCCRSWLGSNIPSCTTTKPDTCPQTNPDGMASHTTCLIC